MTKHPEPHKNTIHLSADCSSLRALRSPGEPDAPDSPMCSRAPRNSPLNDVDLKATAELGKFAAPVLPLPIVAAFSAPMRPPGFKKKDFRLGVISRAAASSSSVAGAGYTLDPETYAIPEESIPRAVRIFCEPELLALEGIGAFVERSQIPLDGYLAYRSVWLASQLALNVQKSLAPLFRTSLSPVKCPVNMEQALFSVDRQVIDLHWLHQIGFRCVSSQREFAGLLSSDEFDFEMASQFALSNVKTTRKVDVWLGLPDEDQCTTGCLHNEAVRRRLQGIRGGTNGSIGAEKICQSLRSVHRGRHDAARRIDDDLCYWRAAEMLPAATAMSRATLFAFMTSRPPRAPHHYALLEKGALLRIASVGSRRKQSAILSPSTP